MLAILGGLGAALAFAVTTLCASRATRMIGSLSVLAWVLFTGFCIVVPWAAFVGVPEVGTTSAAWLALAGCGNVLGLLLAYGALRVGKVGIVAPIISPEGAMGAVIAILAGEDVAAGAGVMLAMIAAGVVLAALASDDERPESGRVGLRVPVLASLAACSFAIALYATGRASADLPVAWAVMPPRLVGTLAVALPL